MDCGHGHANRETDIPTKLQHFECEHIDQWSPMFMHNLTVNHLHGIIIFKSRTPKPMRVVSENNEIRVIFLLSFFRCCMLMFEEQQQISKCKRLTNHSQQQQQTNKLYCIFLFPVVVVVVWFFYFIRWPFTRLPFVWPEVVRQCACAADACHRKIILSKKRNEKKKNDEV